MQHCSVQIYASKCCSLVDRYGILLCSLSSDNRLQIGLLFGNGHSTLASFAMLSNISLDAPIKPYVTSIPLPGGVRFLLMMTRTCGQLVRYLTVPLPPTPMQ